jgi:hypothetical protein
MAAQQPADYTIFCFFVDETCCFPVDISPHDTVGELKDAIKLKNPAFDDLDAHDLDLYLINLADDNSLIEKVKQLLARQPPLQPLKRPTQKLSALFEEPPVDGKVHILVQPPQTGEFLCAGIRQMTRLTNHHTHQERKEKPKTKIQS